jgi:uncharacterized repeat protein (TIGR01451 family)
LAGLYAPGGHGDGAHGIALDEDSDLLYVGDGSTAVKIYNTADWSSAGSITVSQEVHAVAVDPIRGYVYTGNPYGPYGSLGYLCQYDLNTNTETILNIRTMAGGAAGDNVVGIAVDLATGLVYITTGDQGSGGTDAIMVIDTNLNLLHKTGAIGNPTGIVVPNAAISYNPLNLAKDDGLAGACVNPGDTITYTISYDNSGNNNPVTGVVITDTLPGDVTFQSASNGGTEAAGVVTWNIGTIAAGATGSVTVTVTVNAGTAPGTTLTNTCSIDSNETGQAFANADTLVCEDGEEPPVEVGGDIFPANKIALLAPWMLLAAAIIAGTAIAFKRGLIKS